MFICSIPRTNLPIYLPFLASSFVKTKETKRDFPIELLTTACSFCIFAL